MVNLKYTRSSLRHENTVLKPRVYYYTDLENPCVTCFRGHVTCPRARVSDSNWRSSGTLTVHVWDTLLSRGLRGPLCECELCGSGEREVVELLTLTRVYNTRLILRESIVGVYPCSLLLFLAISQLLISFTSFVFCVTWFREIDYTRTLSKRIPVKLCQDEPGASYYDIPLALSSQLSLSLSSYNLLAYIELSTASVSCYFVRLS